MRKSERSTVNVASERSVCAAAGWNLRTANPTSPRMGSASRIHLRRPPCFFGFARGGAGSAGISGVVAATWVSGAVLSIDIGQSLLGQLQRFHVTQQLQLCDLIVDGSARQCILGLDQ